MSGRRDDHARPEPVVALTFVEKDLERGEADAEQADADVVELQPVGQRLPDQVRRIEDHRRRQCEREDADRDVDEEDPAPGVVVGDPAAQRRPDHRRHDHAHAVERHRDALLFAREALDQNGLGDRLQRSAAQALQHAKEDQRAERRRHAAEQRTDGEDADARHVEALPAEQGREPAAQRQHDRVGDEIRRQHPGRFVDAGREVAGDVRQRDVRDAGVEHFHERRQQHDAGDQPGIDGGLRLHVDAHQWCRLLRFVSVWTCVSGFVSRTVIVRLKAPAGPRRSA